MTKLIQYRLQKDAYFASEKGPLSIQMRSQFRGLSYFPEDPSWHLCSALQPAFTQAEYPLMTTDLGTRYMACVGSVSVYDHDLLLFAPLGEENPSHLFLPFQDATSGQETHSLGRYLDVSIDWTTNLVSLDFNYAYQPLCLWQEHASCPIPPSHNKMTISITAGERLAL